jgi:hypothetical protein
MLGVLRAIDNCGTTVKALDSHNGETVAGGDERQCEAVTARTNRQRDGVAATDLPSPVLDAGARCIGRASRLRGRTTAKAEVPTA